MDVFGPVADPPVFAASQPAVSEIRDSALIGSVNPESTTVIYYFEYVDAEDFSSGVRSSLSCRGRNGIETLSGGPVVQTVERLPLTGLLPGGFYPLRMVVSKQARPSMGRMRSLRRRPRHRRD